MVFVRATKCLALTFHNRPNVFLQVVSVRLIHLLLVIQRLSLFKDLGKLCTRLIELRVGLGKFLMSLSESF